MEKNDIERISFLFYHNWKDQLELLDDAQVRQFIYNLISYHEGEDIIINSKLEKAVWNGVLPGLEANKRKYFARAEASRKNGLQGGRPPGNEKPEEPKKPKGFSENPENLIIDNSKEVIDNSKKINENREEINENSKKEIEKSEREIGNSELTTEKIEEFIDDRNKLDEYLNKRVGEILLFNNSVQEKFNPKNIGKDIVDDNQILFFSSEIKESWNSNISLSKKLENLHDIGYKIFSIILNDFSYQNLELLNNHEHDKIPQFYLTRNNLKLHQLHSKLNLFLEDSKKIAKEMSHSAMLN